MAANPYTTNLELQLDARDIVGLSDTDPVETWEDSSAAGNDVTQSNASRRPIYKTNIIGSNPAVRFDAVAESLYGSWSGSWSGATGCTLFWVTQYYASSTWNYPYIYSMGTSSGELSAILGGENGVVSPGRAMYFAYGESAFDTVSLFTLSPGIPVVGGITFKNGSAGMKIISPLATSPERSVTLMDYTCEDFVIGNGYNSGAARTDRGYVGDIAMFLAYKEYMSDSNIGDVIDWILDEFDLHTQEAGGGASIIRQAGMTGGING